MTDQTRIYQTSDWKVWTETPASGAFVLDVSKLNGPDLLGSSASTPYRQLDVGISSITISDGCTMEWLDPSIGFPTASVSFLYEEYDLQILKELFLGKRIAITLANAQTTADVVWGFNTPIFLGLIDNVAIDLVPGQDLVNVSLTASTYNAQYLNFQQPFSKLIGSDKGSALDALLDAPNFRCSLSSNYLYGKTENVEDTIGSYLLDLMQTNTMPPSYFAYIAYNSSGSLTAYAYDNALQINTTTAAKTYGQTYDSSMMFDIELGWNGLNAPTSIELTKSTNTSVVYKYSDDTATNQTFFNASLDVYDLGELTSIAQTMLSFEKEFVPIRISTITARNNQELIFDQNTFGTAWIYPKYLDFTGAWITLELPEYGFDSKEMRITGRTIEVTPETFTTTYDLWKGFN
jgi:hypothetical protein